jgi:hypothetical protein
VCSMASLITRITHWFPIITFCPVNKLPDLIYITIEFNDFVELYSTRNRIRRLSQFKCMFMEDIAKLVFEAFPQASSVELRLAFDKHFVKISK